MDREEGRGKRPTHPRRRYRRSRRRLRRSGVACVAAGCTLVASLCLHYWLHALPLRLMIASLRRRRLLMAKFSTTAATTTTTNMHAPRVQHHRLYLAPTPDEFVRARRTLHARRADDTLRHVESYRTKCGQNESSAAPSSRRGHTCPLLSKRASVVCSSGLQSRVGGNRPLRPSQL